MNMGGKITQIIAGLILLILPFFLYGVQVNAASNLMMRFVDSCQGYEGTRFTEVFYRVTSEPATANSYWSNPTTGVFGGAGIPVTRNGNSCQIAETVTADATGLLAGSATLYSSRGENIKAVTVATAGTIPATTDLVTANSTNAGWHSVPSVMQTFGAVTRLVISLMPLLLTASMITVAAVSLVHLGRGGAESISSGIMASLMGLVLGLVTLFVTSPIFDAIIQAAQVNSSGAQAATVQFGSVSGIIFSLIPLVLVSGTLGLIGGGLYSHFSGKREGGGGMAMDF